MWKLHERSRKEGMCWQTIHGNLLSITDTQRPVQHLHRIHEWLLQEDNIEMEALKSLPQDRNPTLQPSPHPTRKPGMLVLQQIGRWRTRHFRLPALSYDSTKTPATPIHEANYNRDSESWTRIHHRYCNTSIRHRRRKEEAEFVTWIGGCLLKVLRGVCKGWVGESRIYLRLVHGFVFPKLFMLLLPCFSTRFFATFHLI